MGMREGSWWFKSKSDPRWNHSGRAVVGMFMTYKSLPEAKAIFDKNKALYGEPPEDLEFGYEKD